MDATAVPKLVLLHRSEGEDGDDLWWSATFLLTRRLRPDLCYLTRLHLDLCECLTMCVGIGTFSLTLCRVDGPSGGAQTRPVQIVDYNHYEEELPLFRPGEVLALHHLRADFGIEQPAEIFLANLLLAAGLYDSNCCPDFRSFRERLWTSRQLPDEPGGATWAETTASEATTEAVALDHCASCGGRGVGLVPQGAKTCNHCARLLGTQKARL